MDPNKQELICRSLRNLAQAFRSALELLEQTQALLEEEASLDPLAYLRRRSPSPGRDGKNRPVLDDALLTVTHRGKTCFLGNTLPFRFLGHLAQRANAYVAYEDLLLRVWKGNRSDAAVRSIAKSLRTKLRSAGLTELAAAIDGSSARRYVLRLAF